jgi:hypothetical protein
MHTGKPTKEGLFARQCVDTKDTDENSLLKRKALLIGAPDDGETLYLDGVIVDVDRFHQYLKTPLGGAWRDEEIVTLVSPHKREIDRALKFLADADYTFITFSGHGGYNSFERSIEIALRPGVTFGTRQFEGLTPKQTIVLDCCQKRFVPSIEAEALTIKFLTETAAFLNPVRARQEFDAWLSKCASACLVLKACSIDEFAYDGGAEGGLYSSTLIKMAEDFERYMETLEEFTAVVDVEHIHRLARHDVQRLKAFLQNPDIEMPKSMKPLFPFAVFTR